MARGRPCPRREWSSGGATCMGRRYFRVRLHLGAARSARLCFTRASASLWMARVRGHLLHARASIQVGAACGVCDSAVSAWAEDGGDARDPLPRTVEQAGPVLLSAWTNARVSSRMNSRSSRGTRSGAREGLGDAFRVASRDPNRIRSIGRRRCLPRLVRSRRCGGGGR